MTQQALDRILYEYKERAPVYGALAKRVARTLAELLREAPFGVHAVTSRVKQRARLREKLETPGNKYRDLEEITDIAGVRVITYFTDHVDTVSDLIRRTFVIDEENSGDKGKLLDPDRFGYLSRHYVVSLEPATLTGQEHEELAGLKCEVQVRSILQHAWAEIEHDLGYKSKASVPREIRRGFSRLAGLLEIADLEFARIRDALVETVREIDSRVEAGAYHVPIDKPALWSLVRRSPLVNRLDEQIKKTLGATRIDELDAIEQWLPIFGAAGHETIGDLERELAAHAAVLPVYAREFRQAMGRYAAQTPIARGLSVIRAVDAGLAEKGLDALRHAYAASGRQVSEDYTQRLFSSYERAKSAVQAIPAPASPS